MLIYCLFAYLILTRSFEVNSKEGRCDPHSSSFCWFEGWVQDFSDIKHQPLSWCWVSCPLTFLSSHPPTTMTRTVGEIQELQQLSMSSSGVTKHKKHPRRVNLFWMYDPGWQFFTEVVLFSLTVKQAKLLVFCFWFPLFVFSCIRWCFC